MVNKAIDNKKTTFVLCLALTAVIFLAWSMNKTQASVSASVMYFVPQDIQQRDQDITPADFQKIDAQEAGYTSIQEVGYTSDWKIIESLIETNTLDALIIHHEAAEAVEWEKVKTRFQQHGLLVAAIGMPGDELARLLGTPGLYERNRQQLDAWDFDYFLYGMQISGEPDDVTKTFDSRVNGGSEEVVSGIHAPASFSAVVSHGYFSEEIADRQESVMRFLGILDSNLRK
jgi:hypothetical protein